MNVNKKLSVFAIFILVIIFIYMVFGNLLNYDAAEFTNLFCDEKYLYYNNTDGNVYCMALKAKLYDKCMEHLIARKNHVLSAYSRNSECSELSLEYKEKVQKEISEIDFAIEKLEKKDFEYFSHTVEQNETVARANLGIKRTV